MEIIRDIASLRNRLGQETSVALVPTMGNLHEGHLSLVRIAHQNAGCVVTSIFVNQLQFLPGEDFDRYPRTLVEDCRLLEKEGAHVVFAPTATELYPALQVYKVEPSPVAATLEGKFRPGFFQGVATVVLKLLNIVQPRLTVFGKKDYQQLHIIREMVQQLNLPVEIIAGETIRSAEGLALSSRNQYLSDQERTEAACLYQVLNEVKKTVETGDQDYVAIQEKAMKYLESRGWKPDYIALQRRDTLTPVQTGDHNMVVLGAARLGQTRLIDNLEIAARI